MYFTSPVRQGRLHSAFLEKLQESETKNDVLPYAVPEYTLYEAALLGGSDLAKLKKHSSNGILFGGIYISIFYDIMIFIYDDRNIKHL